MSLIRACINIHEEGERVAASKRRGPVPAYTAHHMLQPTSTRDYIRVQSRRDDDDDDGVVVGEEDEEKGRRGKKYSSGNAGSGILPSRAGEYPSSSSATGSSGAIYAMGGTATKNTDTVPPAIRVPAIRVSNSNSISKKYICILLFLFLRYFVCGRLYYQFLVYLY